MKELQWILDNRTFLNISAIELELKTPRGTLRKFVSRERDVPDVWKKPVCEFVKKMKK